MVWDTATHMIKEFWPDLLEEKKKQSLSVTCVRQFTGELAHCIGLKSRLG